MGVYKTPNIYNNGLTIEDVKKLASDYIDISDKFDLKPDIVYTYFIVKYNKLTRLCYIRIQANKHNFTTGINEIATPKSDCPLNEIGNIFTLRVTENPNSASVDTILSMKNSSMYCYVAPDVTNQQGFRFDANGISICELK